MSTKRSQHDAEKGKGPNTKRTPPEGSGLTDHLTRGQQNNDNVDGDTADGVNAKENDGDNTHNGDNADDTQTRDNVDGDNADGDNAKQNDGDNADNGDTADDDDDNNHNDDGGDDDDENRPTNTTSLETSWSNYFTWNYWYPAQNQVNQSDQPEQVSQAEQSPTQLQPYNRGNDSFPSYVYNNIPMVHLWPFVSLFTLASYHLFTIVDFYINMLWKILTVLLAVYTFILNQRVTRLEARCLTCERRYEASDQTQLPALKDLSNLKKLASRHARHQIQLTDHHEPDSAQSLLPKSRRPNDPQTCL